MYTYTIHTSIYSNSNKLYTFARYHPIRISVDHAYMYEEITMFTCFHSYMRKIIAKAKASYTTHMYGFAYIRVYASKIDPLVCHHHRIVCKHFHMNCKHVCYSHKVDSYDDDNPYVVSNIKTRSHHQRAHHSHKTNYTDGTSVLCFVYACDAPQKSYK